MVSPSGVYLRHDFPISALEDLPADAGVLALGALPDHIEVHVAGLTSGQGARHTGHQPDRPQVDVLIEGAAELLPPRLSRFQPLPSGFASRMIICCPRSTGQLMGKPLDALVVRAVSQNVDPTVAEKTIKPAERISAAEGAETAGTIPKALSRH